MPQMAFVSLPASSADVGGLPVPSAAVGGYHANT